MFIDNYFYFHDSHSNDPQTTKDALPMVLKSHHDSRIRGWRTMSFFGHDHHAPLLKIILQLGHQIPSKRVNSASRTSKIKAAHILDDPRSSSYLETTMRDNSTSSESAAHAPDISLWGDQFTPRAFETDPSRWNKDWEKKLRTLTAFEVFTTLGVGYPKGTETSQYVPMFTAQLARNQGYLVKIWTEIQDLREHYVTAWVLLSEKEREKYLMKGFEECAKGPTVFYRDARSLAPEITTSALLKRHGNAFIDFIDAYVKAKQDAGEGIAYFLPNPWWEEATEGLPDSALEHFHEKAHELLTLNRNNFISEDFYIFCFRFQ